MPVSYTHLDVYKRQAINNAQRISGEMPGIKCSDQNSHYHADCNDERGKAGRVFCTHILDVYKRQAVQRYDYFCKLQAKSIIFIAVIAHSSPLLPSLPPALSSACSMVLVVINP